MTKQERIAFRILANLYPDSRPSEIRKIIDDALSKDERIDDMELWAALTKEKVGEEPVKEKIIEHHYHDWYHPWVYTYASNESLTTPLTNSPIITCNDNITLTSEKITF